MTSKTMNNETADLAENTKERVLVTKDKELEARRELVKNYIFVTRMSIKECIESLRQEGFRTSARTTERDIAAIREQIVREVKTNTAADLIAKSVAQSDEIIKKAWTTYLDTDNKANKIRALQLIHDVEDSKLQTYEKLGLIEKIADKLQVEERGYQFIIQVENKKEVIDVTPNNQVEANAEAIPSIPNPAGQGDN